MAFLAFRNLSLRCDSSHKHVVDVLNRRTGGGLTQNALLLGPLTTITIKRPDFHFRATHTLVPFPRVGGRVVWLCVTNFTHGRPGTLSKHARNFASHRTVSRRTCDESLHPYFVHPPPTSPRQRSRSGFSFHSFIIFGLIIFSACSSAVRFDRSLLSFITNNVGLDPCLTV
jgi:hypothetical protein